MSNDPVTLQTLVAGPLFGHGWAFDTESPRAFATFTSFPGGNSAPLSVIDTNTLALVDAFTIPGVTIQAMVVLPRPAAPQGLTASVAGTSVEVSWSHGPSRADTTRYVLDVGSLSGSSGILSGVDLGLQTSLSASGVPAGRYYVRVRAGNCTGSSGPSNEVVVQVP